MKALYSVILIASMLVSLRGNIWDTELGHSIQSKAKYEEVFSSVKPPSASFSEVADNEQGHSIALSSNMNGLDYTTWYTNLNDIVANRENKVMISDIVAYKNPPWDSTEDTYFFYQHKAKMDLYDFLTSRDIQAAQGRQSSRDFVENHYLSYMNGWDPTGHRPIEGFTPNKTAYCTVDGVRCVFCGPMPAAIYKDYVSSGKWAEKSWPGVEWENKAKYCIILVPKGADREDSSNYIYLPAVSGSSKAHTYPYGVTQTNVSVTSPNSIAAFLHTGGDYAKKYDLAANDTNTIKYIAQTYDDGRGNHMLDYIYCGVELCFPGSRFYDALHEYDFVGYLVYK